jgi:hypothetical protein
MSHSRKVKRKLRKDKKDSVVATLAPTGSKFSIVYDPVQDRVLFPDAKIEQLHQAIYYDRDSGKEKIVSQIPCQNEKGYLSQIKSLQANVDFLFAVDTNTTEIDGQRTSFCVSYHVPQILSIYRSVFPFTPFAGFEINEVCPAVNPERVGWHLLITHILEAAAYDPRQRIGIIVDSELRLHPAINCRESPYYADHLLPLNIQLIYASADVGKNELANQMMSYCDKAASITIECFLTQRPTLNQRTNGDSFFRGWRPLPFTTYDKTAK